MHRLKYMYAQYGTDLVWITGGKDTSQKSSVRQKQING